MGLVKETKKVIKYLDIFNAVGVAALSDFEDLSETKHPAKLMEDVESVIVFVDSNASGEMGIIDDYFGVIGAQNDVVDYLSELGYRAVVIDPSTTVISFVTMGIKAGIGDISPVNSLVVKGIGLTGSIGVILTNAPLSKTRAAEKACINCMKCLDICPIREKANEIGDLDNCACSKCVNICPV